jgi:hypothetical protein
MDGKLLTTFGPLRTGVLANVRSGRMSCRNCLAVRRKASPSRPIRCAGDGGAKSSLGVLRSHEFVRLNRTSVRESPRDHSVLPRLLRSCFRTSAPEYFAPGGVATAKSIFLAKVRSMFGGKPRRRPSAICVLNTDAPELSGAEPQIPQAHLALSTYPKTGTGSESSRCLYPFWDRLLAPHSLVRRSGASLLC